MSDDKKKKKEKKISNSPDDRETGISDVDALYLASSTSLTDWNRPEEDDAWKDL